VDVLTFERLKKLQSSQGKDFGKIVQQLLGIAFCRLGFRRTEDRLVEGVDFDFVRGTEKLAVEVKTTQGDAVALAEKDIDGLARRQADGYLPLVAALQTGTLSDWVIARSESLRPGSIPFSSLSSLKHAVLEADINRLFPDVVTQYSGEIERERRGKGITRISAILNRECSNNALKI